MLKLSRTASPLLYETLLGRYRRIQGLLLSYTIFTPLNAYILALVSSIYIHAS